MGKFVYACFNVARTLPHLSKAASAILVYMVGRNIDALYFMECERFACRTQKGF